MKLRTQEIILQLRAIGMSQSKIAREINVPQSRISRWESGDVPNSADNALALADLLRANNPTKAKNA